MHIIEECVSKAMGKSFEIVVCDRVQIKDYLFDAENPSEFSTYNKLRFEMIDFIIMEGSPVVLPWESKMSYFRLLFQMCKLTHKPCYTSGFGI